MHKPSIPGSSSPKCPAPGSTAGPPLPRRRGRSLNVHHGEQSGCSAKQLQQRDVGEGQWTSGNTHALELSPQREGEMVVCVCVCVCVWSQGWGQNWGSESPKKHKIREGFLEEQSVQETEEQREAQRRAQAEARSRK